jgi:hypothetical protein
MCTHVECPVSSTAATHLNASTIRDQRRQVKIGERFHTGRALAALSRHCDQYHDTAIFGVNDVGSFSHSDVSMSAGHVNEPTR